MANTHAGARVVRGCCLVALCLLPPCALNTVAQDAPKRADKPADTRIVMEGYGFSIDSGDLKNWPLKAMLSSHAMVEAELKDLPNTSFKVTRYRQWEGFQAEYERRKPKPDDGEKLTVDESAKLGGKPAQKLITERPVADWKLFKITFISKSSKGETGWIVVGTSRSAQWDEAKKKLESAISSFRFLGNADKIKETEHGNTLYRFAVATNHLDNVSGPELKAILSMSGVNEADGALLTLQIQPETTTLDNWAKETRENLKRQDYEVSEEDLKDWNGTAARRLSYPGKQEGSTVELLLFNHRDCHWSLFTTWTSPAGAKVCRAAIDSFKFEVGE